MVNSVRDVADRLSVDHVAEIIMNPGDGVSNNHRLLGVYVLFVWARFPDLARTIDYYAAQGALRFASRYRLSVENEAKGNVKGKKHLRGVREAPRSGEELACLFKNFETVPFLKSFVTSGGLWLAAEAQPAWMLDKVTNQTKVIQRRDIVAKYIVSALRTEPALLNRDCAEQLLREGFMNARKGFWGGDKSGPAEGSAFANYWKPKDKALLLRHFLGLAPASDIILKVVPTNMPKVKEKGIEGKASNANTAFEAEDDEIPDDDVELLRTPYEEFTQLPTLYSEFFETHIDEIETFIPEIRSRLWAYRIFIEDAQIPRVVRNNWSVLENSSIWSTQGRADGNTAKKEGAKILERYRFDEQQVHTAKALLVGISRKKRRAKVMR